MIGDRCYTTRSGLRIGSAYSTPICRNPIAIQRCHSSAKRDLRDMAVVWACIVAACALAMILIAEAV